MKVALRRLHRRARTLGKALAAMALFSVSVAAQPLPRPQEWQPPAHTADWPQIAPGRNRLETIAALDAGPQLERGRSPEWLLAEHRRLTDALATLRPQRPGTVDAYVIAAGLDSDPVFGREAREAGKVLAHRYDAGGRSITLAGTSGSAPSDLPNGSPESVALALARVAELMDPAEDVLILYTTSHGAPQGLAYHDGDSGYGVISPGRLKAMLDDLGIRNRLILLSACYSGIFVPVLASDTTAIVTAASAVRPSFGCMAENDWTFFGDALINHALRAPQPLSDAADAARRLIAGWEVGGHLQPSNPQVSLGGKVADWLAPLERRMPRDETRPVGRPAIDMLDGKRG